MRYSEEYDETIPDTSLSQFVLERIEQFGTNVACINSETKQSLTYNDIVRLCKQFACGLKRKCNVQPYQTVAIVLPSSLEYAVITLAVNALGATATLVNPSHTIGKVIIFFKHVVCHCCYLRYTLFDL